VHWSILFLGDRCPCFHEPKIAVVVLLTLGLGAACKGQDPQKKSVPSECTKTIRVHGSLPKGPFEPLPGESYKGPPLVKYQIQQDGTVSNVIVTRSSGVADIDKKILDAVARWKYKPRSVGCGVIDTEMSVILDPFSLEIKN
jgi:TonB family protein